MGGKGDVTAEIGEGSGDGEGEGTDGEYEPEREGEREPDPYPDMGVEPERLLVASVCARGWGCIGARRFEFAGCMLLELCMGYIGTGACAMDMDTDMGTMAGESWEGARETDMPAVLVGGPGWTMRATASRRRAVRWFR